MRKIVIYNILLFSLFLIYNSVFAQNKDSDIKKSENIITIDNKKFYIHKVKQGETLWEIYKAYNVDEKTIKQVNPGITDALKLNQEIKIPVNKNDINISKNSDDFIYHTIEKGESIWSLSKKYKIDEKIIINYNPGVEKGLKAGEQIKIPKPKSVNKSDKNNKKENEIKNNNNKTKTNKKDDNVNKNESNKTKKDIKVDNNQKDTSKYIYHKVQKQQTLFFLAKKYNVEIEDIHRANPEISQTGLKPGMTIKIPKTQLITHEVLESLNNQTTKSKNIIDTTENKNITNENSNEIAKCDNFNYKATPINFKVALLLPFYNDAISLQKEDDENQDNKNSKIIPTSKPFLEFYEGALLAIDSLKKQGLNLDLYVFDTRKDSNEVKTILQKSEFKQMNLIIGPVFYPNVQVVADFAKKNKINFISPLSSNDDFLINNPYCFQVNPSINTQVEQSAIFYGSYKNKNIVVVHNGTQAELDIIKTFKNKMLKVYSENNNSNNILYKEILYTKTGISGVENALSKTNDNIVILPSSNQVFILNILTSLNSLLKVYKISILGFPSWKKFENNLELEYVHNLEMNIFSPYYVDYNDSITKNFILKYRNVYKNEPTKYSFCGFDICYYFLSALKKYGKNLQPCIQNYNIELLQSEFNFKRINKYSGFENNSIYIINYDKEFNIKKINKVDNKLEKPIIE